MPEIIVEVYVPLTEREKKLLYGYKGELIRCKDCKSAYRAEVYSPSIRCEITNCILTTEDYCSLGERRTKDD